MSLRIKFAVVSVVVAAATLANAADRTYRRVLIAGNSITCHGPSPTIGWTNNWGMAASTPEKDYVHLLLKGMEERSGVRPEYRNVGWGFLNDGTTDKAMVDAECAKALEWKPDLLITAQGENGHAVAASNELAKAVYLQVVQNLRQAGVDVVLRAPFWKSDGKYSKMLASVAGATGAKFVDIGDLSQDDANTAKGLFWHGGVAMHPGDRGMKLIADRILDTVYPPAEKTDGYVSGWIRPTDTPTLAKLLDGDGGTVWRMGGCAWQFLHSYPYDGNGKEVLMRHFCYDQKARRDEWIHVAFAWRGDRVRFYIDGMPCNPAASFAENVREVVGNRANAGVRLWTEGKSTKGFRLKKGAWTAKEITDEYRAVSPVDMVMTDSYIPADDPAASAVWVLAPGGAFTRPKPFEGYENRTATLEVATEIRRLEKGEPVGEVLAATPFTKYEVTKEIELKTAPKAWPPGVYRMLVSFRRPGSDETHCRSLFFRAHAKTVTPPPSRDEWKLGEVFFEKTYEGPRDCRFSAGETAASRNPRLKYVEAGGVIGNRFADILAVPAKYVAKPCCLEIEWPDDRPREMGLYMYEMVSASCRDHLQGGLATGVEIPVTGKMQVRRHYYIPGGTNVMFEARTAAGDRPAAIARIRLIAIDGPLPVLKIRRPAGGRGRGFGHLDEDQTFENNLAHPMMGGPPDMINPRLIEYFGYTGQNLMSYSIVRYMMDQSPLDHQTKVSFWPKEQGAFRGVIRELEEHGIHYFCQGWMDTPPTIGRADVLDQELEKRGVLLRNRDGSFVKNQFSNCGVFFGDPRSAEAREIIVRDYLPALGYAVDSGCAAVSMNGNDPFSFKPECMPEDVDCAAEAVTKSVGGLVSALRKRRPDLQFNLTLSGAEDELRSRGLDAKRLVEDAKVSLIAARNHTAYYFALFTGKSMEGTDSLDRLYDPEAPNLRRLAAVSPGGSLPVVQSYNSYFETFNSPLGDDRRFNNYFQNSDVRPHGRWYLKEPAYCLAKCDMLDYVHGSQPFASIGYESETREFCAAYCALPRRPFRTMKGVDDPVVGRFLRTGEGVYFYVVNYCHLPVTATLGAEVEALELSSEKTAKFSEVALRPFELRSFLVSAHDFAPETFELRLSSFDPHAFDARFAEVGKAAAAFDEKGLDCGNAKERIAKARAALAEGRLAATHYHLYHRHVNGLMEKFGKLDEILAVDGQHKAGRWLVNCGCNHYTRIDGLVFSPDRKWDGGDYGWFGRRNRQWQRDLQYCDEKAKYREVYATELFEIDGYRFRLPKGRYRVKLHVKWGYPHTWRKDVIAATYYVNGRLLDGFDFYARQGGDIRNTVVLETTVDVDDLLTISVEPGDAKTGLVCTDRCFALFNAIEITREHGEGTRRVMVDRAAAVLRKCTVRNGVFGLKHAFVAPGGYGDCWWQLDSTSALEGMKMIDFVFAERSILDFANVQKPDGRIPLWGRDVLPKSPNHPLQSEGASSLPSIFRSAHDIALASGNAETTRALYGICARYLGWWRKNRLDARTGLVTSLFEETFPPYLGRAGEWSGVDTNVEVARGAILTAELAVRLGRTQEAEELRGFAAGIFAAVEKHLWNEKAGLFCPLDLRSGSFGGASSAGFWMFWDPALPASRRARMLAELKGPRFGWGRYPLTSMARDDPSFTITRGDAYRFNASWSGMVWSTIVIRTVEALASCGFEAESAELRDRFLRMIERAGEFREFYDPDDGTGHGAHDYAWTAAHYLRLVAEGPSPRR